VPKAKLIQCAQSKIPDHVVRVLGNGCKTS